jgi:hypothetical protein
VAAGRPVRLVWQNPLGGLTFEIGAGDDRCFVKWTPASSGIDLGGEAARLAWARPFTPVPRLLDQGTSEAGSWIVTAALPGQHAATSRWRAALTCITMLAAACGTSSGPAATPATTATGTAGPATAGPASTARASTAPAGTSPAGSGAGWLRSGRGGPSSAAC